MQPSTWLFAPGPVYCARLHQLDKRGRCPVTIDTRWMDVDKLLQPIPKNTEELRQRAVQDVAQARFEFPTTELPSYRAFVNAPEVTLPVIAPDGTQLTPDIVVVDTPGNLLKIVAQVETSDHLTEERAKE